MSEATIDLLASAIGALITAFAAYVAGKARGRIVERAQPSIKPPPYSDTTEP